MFDLIFSMNNIIEKLYNYVLGGSLALLRTTIAIPKVPILSLK
jgi:hypothetical protein